MENQHQKVINNFQLEIKGMENEHEKIINIHSLVKEDL